MEESKAKEGPKPGVVLVEHLPKKDTPKPPMKKWWVPLIPLNYGGITPEKRGVVGVHCRDSLVFSIISLVVMTFCGPLGWWKSTTSLQGLLTLLRNLHKQKQSRQADSSRDAVWNQWREDFPGYRPQTSLSSLARCLGKNRFFWVTFIQGSYVSTMEHIRKEWALPSFLRVYTIEHQRGMSGCLSTYSVMGFPHNVLCQR